MARETKKSNPVRWRLWLAIGGFVVLGASTAIAAHRVRSYALTDPRFRFDLRQAGALTVQGAQFAPRTKISRVFAADSGHSVLAVPLAERRRRLLAIDWVEDASVSRIWPDRLAVRIRERRPVAFAVLEAGVMLVDESGVLMEVPPQSRFTLPVLRGSTENESELRRSDRVAAMQALQRDLGPAFKNISEVNAADPENLRVVTRVEGNPVDLILGGENFNRRYQNFLAHYSEIHKRSPEARTFDLRLDGRFTTKD